MEPSILEVLKEIHQGVHWAEDEAPPPGIAEAIALKLAKPDDGSGWNTQCGARLTNAGRIAIGLKPRSLLKRIFA